jgi:DNA repair exonuclease SbcCD nuclease subunit
MKQLRFIHTADWHADSDPKKQAKLEASLDQLVEYCSNVKVNTIIHAGDVFEKSQKFQFNSGVPIVLKYLHKLSKLVDFIFITKGNNSHDEPGSISLLHQIEPNVYAYEYPVSLAVHQDSNLVMDILRMEGQIINGENLDFIISLVPYPTKASLLIEDSIDNNNANFLDKFEQVFEHIGNVTLNYNCPKLLAFHGNVQGSQLSTGQTLVSQDIMVSPSTLGRALHDYYALGHIHLRQEIKPNIRYSGSIYNKSWGETEQKSFTIVDFEEETISPWVMSVGDVLLNSARPMITVDAEFVDNDFNWDLSITDNDANANAEFRFRCKVKENERNLITDDKIEWLKSFFGQDVKIEFNIVPVERESRSEKIMNCKTLLDEVKEYAEVINQPINGTIEKKVAQLQEVGI